MSESETVVPVSGGAVEDPLPRAQVAGEQGVGFAGHGSIRRHGKTVIGGDIQLRRSPNQFHLKVVMVPLRRKRISLPPARWICLLGMWAVLFWAGCERAPEIVDETETRAYRRAKSLLKEGRDEQALTAFLEVIDSRQIAPESHLEAGLIYLNDIQDPLSAIYHFQRYLQFKGSGERAETVRELIGTAQKEFLRSIPGDPFGDELRRLDLSEKFADVSDENENLRKEIVSLRQQLDAVQKRSTQLEAALREARASGNVPREVAPIVVAPSSGSGTSSPVAREERPSTYVVQAGDTLSLISRKVYGTPSRWADIYRANRDVLPSADALKVGQELRIP